MTITTKAVAVFSILGLWSHADAQVAGGFSPVPLWPSSAEPSKEVAEGHRVFFERSMSRKSTGRRGNVPQRVRQRALWQRRDRNTSDERPNVGRCESSAARSRNNLRPRRRPPRSHSPATVESPSDSASPVPGTIAAKDISCTRSVPPSAAAPLPAAG